MTGTEIINKRRRTLKKEMLSDLKKQKNKNFLLQLEEKEDEEEKEKKEDLLHVVVESVEDDVSRSSSGSGSDSVSGTDSDSDNAEGDEEVDDMYVSTTNPPSSQLQSEIMVSLSFLCSSLYL